RRMMQPNANECGEIETLVRSDPVRRSGKAQAKQISNLIT
ncbi:hypothetical protein AVEN_126051-2-1, partial [Araneus ventricosus]